jgi:hypothetical protein
MPAALMRMLVDAASGVTPSAADRAYMSGMDQIPWPCRSRLINGNELVIERGVPDSGRVQVPFTVEGRGELLLSTATLMQRDKPYSLEIELARGKLNQVRNQLAEWQSLGLTVPATLEASVKRALQEFSLATSTPENPAVAAQRARQALSLAIDAAEALIDTYAEQATTMRMRQTGRLPTLLAIHLGHRMLAPQALAQVTTAFNALTVSMVWREIESQEGQYNWQIPDGSARLVGDVGRGLRLVRFIPQRLRCEGRHALSRQDRPVAMCGTHQRHERPLIARRTDTATRCPHNRSDARDRSRHADDDSF